MLVTVQNVSGAAINGLALGEDGIATGGQRSNPLPYPFGHIGELADTASKQLPMHPADWNFKIVPWLPLTPREEWNQLVNAGVVTIAVAAQADRSDNEELFLNAV